MQGNGSLPLYYAASSLVREGVIPNWKWLNSHENLKNGTNFMKQLGRRGKEQTIHHKNVQEDGKQYGYSTIFLEGYN